MSFKQEYAESAVKALKNIAKAKDQKYCKDKALAYMKENINASIEKTRKIVADDMARASFGLKPKRPTQLMISAAKAALGYEVVQWAKQILEHAKITSR